MSGALSQDPDRAARFDGVDNRVSMGDPASGILDFGSADFSLEAWVKTSTNAERTVAGKKGSGRYWLVTITDDPSHVGQLRAIIRDGAVTRQAYSLARVDDGAWHHVVVLFDRDSGISFYIDGAPSGFTAGAMTGSVSNTAAFMVGKVSGYTHYQGDGDEVALYPALLPAQRIQAHYQAGVTDTAPPAVTLTTPSHNGSTTDTTPTFAGAAGTASGDSSTVTVKVYSGSTVGGTPVQTPTTTAAGGSYSVAASTPLAVGTYTAQAEQADAAGNTGFSSANTFTITLTDQSPPVVTLTTPANLSSTGDATPTFAGGAGTEPGDSATVTVNVYNGSSPVGPLVQTLTATAAGGAYSVDASMPLVVGTYTARAEQSDTAGNTGLSTANTFTVTSGDPVLVGAGDIADCGESAQDEETAQLLDALPNATVFTLGDNAYNIGTASEFANCYEPTWGRHKARTRPSPGNHDYGTPGAAGYFGYFGAAAGDPGKGYYSYDVGDWHVIVLNTNCFPVGGCDPGDPQEQWLRNDLAANPTDCTLAYFHHPLFTSRTDSQDPASETFWQVLYQHGADLIVTGHAHVYERFAPQTPTGALDLSYGIRQITAGTGGYSLYSFETVAPNSQVRLNDAHGVLKLTLHPTSYDWQFLPVAGRTSTDAGTTACHGPPGTPPPPPPPAACADGLDNDGDGLVDFPADPGCASSSDTDETDAPPPPPPAACADGLDNDGDGLTDYPADPGCADLLDTDETDPPPPPPPGSSPSVRSAAFATANGPVTQLTIARPSATAAGDLLVAIVAHQGGTAKNMTPPTGWTAVPNTDWAQGTNARIHAWYRLAGTAEPTGYTFSMVGSGDDMSGGILAVSNTHPTAPINASNGQSNGSTPSTSVTAPSLTTTAPNALLLFGGACAGAVSFTQPLGMSEHWDAATSGLYKVSTQAAAQAFAPAGATGTRVATASSSCRSVAIQIAVAPA